MPRTSTDWHLTQFGTPDMIRAEADKWVRIAELAEADGDMNQAAISREQAASLRQVARIKLVDGNA